MKTGLAALLSTVLLYYCCIDRYHGDQTITITSSLISPVDTARPVDELFFGVTIGDESKSVEMEAAGLARQENSLNTNSSSSSQGGPVAPNLAVAVADDGDEPHVATRGEFVTVYTVVVCTVLSIVGSGRCDYVNSVSVCWPLWTMILLLCGNELGEAAVGGERFLALPLVTPS